MQIERGESHPRPEKKEIKLSGRVLFLTRDPDLLRQQIKGLDLVNISFDQLLENISTDEITPSRSCAFETDPQKLGEFALTGLRGGVIKTGDLKKGNFEAIVAGRSFGCGSSREHAPLALIGAGIKFIAAEQIERIFLQNSHNQGLFTIQENPDLVAKLLKHKSIDLNEFTKNEDPITQEIICRGGLLPYLKARLEGKARLPTIETGCRPMTMAEKIIAANIVNPDGSIGVRTVKPGDSSFIKADFRYSYELSTPLGESMLQMVFNEEDIEVKDPQSIALFQDHLALFENTGDPRLVLEIVRKQKTFARRHGLKVYEPKDGICHNVMAERHALPGQVIFGTDSHTCSLGAVGALALGIGATEMAGAWLTGDCRIKVPPTWRFNFYGELAENITAKDVMLSILSQPPVRQGKAVSRVFEFAGYGLENWPFDELFVLANMSVEGGAATGIVEPNQAVFKHLVVQHHLEAEKLASMTVKSDLDAEFEEVIEINLSKIKPMVALPGDPRNGVPLKEVAGVKPDAVYVGSCTGGKLEDLQQFARIVKGRKVQVPTYIQANSLSTRKLAERLGLIETFREAGVVILEPGCGDCCDLGIGIAKEGQTIVSDTNRNFPGRMGPAEVYLVNPAVAAATAIAGEITSPEKL